MTSIAKLLFELERRRIRPLIREGKLHLVGPKSGLAADLIDRVRACASEMKLALQSGADSAARSESKEIDIAIAVEIARVELEAMRRGWTHERLWGERFWPVEARGLAALLDEGDRVEQVRSDYITIVKRDGARQRYWRHQS
jgi:hypothetical protein